MIKSVTVIEITKGDRTYKLLCESESPLGEVHDVLCEMRKNVIELMAKTEERSEEKVDDNGVI